MSSLQSDSQLKNKPNRSKSYNQRVRKRSDISYQQSLRFEKIHDDNIQVFQNQYGKSQFSHSPQSSVYVNQSNRHNRQNMNEQQSDILHSQVTKIRSSSQANQTKRRMTKKSIQKNIKDNKKNLDEVKVEYKKIEQYQSQRNLQWQARNFVLKLKQKKSQFQGKLYLMKRNQQMRKKQKQRKEKQIIFQSSQIKKMLRKKEIQEKLKLFKEKQLQRINKQEKEQRAKKRRATLQKEPETLRNKLQKIKIKYNRYSLAEDVKPKTSPTNLIGNKYLKQSGRVQKRARTQSSHYNDLTEQERQQLDKIRQKIEILTKIIKY